MYSRARHPVAAWIAFFSKLCHQTYTWKKILKTIHQLSCFLGHRLYKRKNGDFGEIFHFIPDKLLSLFQLFDGPHHKCTRLCPKIIIFFQQIYSLEKLPPAIDIEQAVKTYHKGSCSIRNKSRKFYNFSVFHQWKHKYFIKLYCLTAAELKFLIKIFAFGRL